MASLRATPAIDAAGRAVADLPNPRRPTDAEDYDFPDDVSKLTSPALGNMRLKLSRVHGYALYKVAQIDRVLGPGEEVFHLKRDLAVARLAKDWGKRLPAVEVLRALVIDEDPGLVKMAQQLIELRAQKRQLELQLQIYERHLSDLSREMSRRQAEAEHFA